MSEITIKDNPLEESVEIEGVKYSYDLFKQWGKDGMPIGTTFEIISRHPQYHDILVIDAKKDYYKKIMERIGDFDTVVRDDDTQEMRKYYLVSKVMEALEEVLNAA